MIPAHNEELLLPRGLAAVQHAVERSGSTAEIVVVANRCTDRTVQITKDAGAVVVHDSSCCLGAIRNAGVAASHGAVVVTIDADSVMHEDALREVNHLVDTGRYVGGGCRHVPERSSLGINVSLAFVNAALMIAGLGGAMYWCMRSDFDAVGGFDESLSVAEDLDFARRLRRHGRRTGRRFMNVRHSPVVVSCRKFDTFGDWHVFNHTLIRGLNAVRKGDDPSYADAYFYDHNA